MISSSHKPQLATDSCILFDTMVKISAAALSALALSGLNGDVDAFTTLKSQAIRQQTPLAAVGVLFFEIASSWRQNLVAM